MKIHLNNEQQIALVQYATTYVDSEGNALQADAEGNILAIKNKSLRRTKFARWVSLHFQYYYNECDKLMYWYAPTGIWQPMSEPTSIQVFTQFYLAYGLDIFTITDRDIPKIRTQIIQFAPMQNKTREDHLYEPNIQILACWRYGMQIARCYVIGSEEWRDALPEDYIVSPLNFNPDATIPEVALYHTSMMQIIADAEDRRWVEAYMFYCLTRLTNQEVNLCLVGPGRDGKSRLAWFMRELLGPTLSCKTRFNVLLDQSGHGLTIIQRKTLSTCDEFPEGRIRDTVVGQLKDFLIAKDIQINPKGLTSYNIRLYCKMLFTSNRLPEWASSVDTALCRRLKIVAANREFRENTSNWLQLVDTTRWEDILEFERDYVIHYLIETYADCYTDIVQPDPDETIRLWEQLGGNVAAFLSEHYTIIFEEDAYVKKEDILTHYNQWCADLPNAKALGRNHFYEALEKRGCVSSQRSDANNEFRNQWVFVNIMRTSATDTVTLVHEETTRPVIVSEVLETIHTQEVMEVVDLESIYGMAVHEDALLQLERENEIYFDQTRTRVYSQGGFTL